MSELQRPRGSPYDNAVKLPVESERAAFCQLIGASLAARRLGEELPGVTLRADWLLQADDGSIIQVEFERSPKSDLGERVFRYRARLHDEHPGKRIEVWVVLLDSGNPTGFWTPDDNVWIRYGVVKLRELDPEDFLAQPGTAMFAVLTKAADKTERQTLLRRSLEVIRAGCDERDQRRLMGGAMALAGIHLSPEQIQAAWEEADMPFDVTETELYHVILAQGEARGHAEGKAAGVYDGRVGLLRYLLIDRFGVSGPVDEIAGRLAHLDPGSAAHALNKAKTLDELLG